MNNTDAVVKEQRAGIVIIVHMDGEPVALLTRRGKLNPEKIGVEPYGRESWAGACQVTAHGRSKSSDEGPYSTMLRELREERGQKWADIVGELNAREHVYVANVDENEKRVITTYGVYVTEERLSELKHTHKPGLTIADFVGLELTAGATLEPLPKSKMDQLRPLEKSEKSGVRDLEAVAMFPDEIVAVRAALEKAQE